MLSALLLTMCGFLAAPAAQQAPAPQAKHDPAAQAKKQADEFLQNIWTGDAAKAVDYMHPDHVKKYGGRDQMIAAVLLARELVKDLSEEAQVEITIEMTAEAPGPIVKGGDDLYTVIPYQVKTTGAGKQTTNRDFMVGVSSNGGKSWTFVGGSDEEIAQVLPNLPQGLQLPERPAKETGEVQ
jgi:hypothetical protein